MKTILCPVDFSKSSINAVEYASFLANDFGAEIILLHVYEAPSIYSDIPIEVIQNSEEDIVGAANEKLKSLKLKLTRKFKNVKYSSFILEGVVSKAVADFAKRKEVDLIIAGKTGNSKIKRMLLGSTAASIIRDADCPVLTVPPDNVFTPIQKIVFATDLHEDNIGSSLAITSFARHFDAEIIFVFVDDRHLIHSEEKINEMTRKIKKRIKYPKMSGYIAKNTSIAKGIEYFLQKNKADILVMFSHKRRFPGSIFNQSMTKLVSYQAKIPLLALKISDGSILD